MGELKAKEPQKLRSFGWKSNLNAPEIYANYVHLGWSLDDVRMIFGSLKAENVSSKEFFAEEKATVIMSYRQVKNLASNLTRLLASYEEANGVIETPVLAELDKPKDAEKEQNPQ